MNHAVQGKISDGKILQKEASKKKLQQVSIDEIAKLKKQGKNINYITR